MSFISKKRSFFGAIRTILSVLWWICVILLAILVFHIFRARMNGEVPRVFGYSVVNIVSGSMEDEIPTGSYILIREIAPEEVKRGDIICFYSTDPAIYGMPNTHRVVEEPIRRADGIEFITRGDANPGNDAVAARGDRLVGVYVKRLDALAGLAGALHGKTVILLIIALQIGLCAMVVYTLVKGKSAREAEPTGPSGDTKEK